MTTQSTENVIMLGPREAVVLRLLWLHGPSTVRELLGRIEADPPIAYIQWNCFYSKVSHYCKAK